MKVKTMNGEEVQYETITKHNFPVLQYMKKGNCSTSEVIEAMNFLLDCNDPNFENIIFNSWDDILLRKHQQEQKSG